MERRREARRGEGRRLKAGLGDEGSWLLRYQMLCWVAAWSAGFVPQVYNCDMYISCWEFLDALYNSIMLVP